jgi:hypothetical protein
MAIYVLFIERKRSIEIVVFSSIQYLKGRWFMQTLNWTLVAVRWNDAPIGHFLANYDSSLR